MRCVDSFFARRWAPFLLLGVVTLLLWGHSFTFQFVWDDKQFIQELESIRSLRNVPAMFTSLEAQSSLPEGFKLFRPLRTLQYALLYQLCGGQAPSPWIYHFCNVLWHAGTAMLLYAVALLMFQRLLPGITERATQWLALLTAVGFAVHPVVSEVVCWAKSLDDMMAALFTLASMRALLKWKGDRRAYALALLWFLLAVYSKISAVPFALMALFIFLQVLKMPLARAAKLSSGFWIIALVFLVHRHLVIGQSSQTAPLSGTYGQTLIDMFPVAPQYLRLLCGVPPFCIDYSFMSGQIAIVSGPSLCGLAILLTAATAVWLGSRKAGSALAAFGLAWVGAFLLPVSNLLPMMQYMAERFLYLPLIGWLFVLAFLTHRLSRWRPIGAVAVGGLLAWSALAWDRSWIWADEVTLFVTTSREHPGIRRVEDNAVAAIFNLPHVREMFVIDGSSHTLRLVDSVPQEQRQAIHDTLVQASQLFPADVSIHSALGMLHVASGQPGEAVPFFRLVVQQRPDEARFWLNLAQALMETDAGTEAQEAMTKALSLRPDDLDVLRIASCLAWRAGDYEIAASHFRKLKSLEPGEPEHARWLQEAERRLAARPGRNGPCFPVP